MDKDEKMLVQMTKAELRELISDVVRAMDRPSAIKEQTEWYDGLDGLKEIFKVGTNKALEIKNSGVINDANVYTGTRSFIVNCDQARKLWKQHIDLVKQGVKA